MHVNQGIHNHMKQSIHGFAKLLEIKQSSNHLFNLNCFPSFIFDLQAFTLTNPLSINLFDRFPAKSSALLPDPARPFILSRSWRDPYGNE
ncbi:hypothetical protein LguiA_011984 [Lonicera macranthoides]